MRYGMLAIWVLILLPAIRLDAQPASVGELSDLREWEIIGVESFDVEQVRAALAYDLDLLLAAHPAAPLDQLANAIRDRVAAGYRHVGFPKASIDVGVDDTGVRITVKEQQRYRAGKVLVKGVDEQLAQQIRASLVKPPVAAGIDESQPEDALWVAGEPVAFDANAQQQRRETIDIALRESGILESSTELRFAYRDNGQADLIVDVAELGKAATIHKIAIEGTSATPRQAILDHLNLRAGVEYSPTLIKRIEADLRRCGRFSKHEVTVAANSGRTQLTIELEDTPGAPPLPQPLPRAATVLLRHQRWTVEHGRQYDVVYTMPTPFGFAELVTAPDEGILGMLWEDQTQRKLRFVIACTAEGATLVNFVDGRKLVVPRGDRGVSISQRVEVNANEADTPFRYRFGLGVNSDRKGPWLKYEEQLPPAFFVATAMLAEPPTLDDEIMTLQTRLGTLKVDSQSGRLIELNSPDRQMRYTRERGRFQRRWREVRNASKHLVDEYDPHRPVTTIAQFAAATPVRGDWAKSLDLLGSLADQGLFAPVDEELTAPDDGDELADRFTIPHQPANSYAGLAPAVISLADTLFERGTWPWTVVRETGFTLAGRQQYTRHEVNRLLGSPGFGPIGHVVLAKLFEQLGADQPMVLLAANAQRRGRMSEAAFARDLHQLLGPHDAFAAHSLQWLSSLYPREIDALAKSLDMDTQSLTHLVNAAKSAPAWQRPRDSLAYVLGQIWSREWQAQAQAHFWHILEERGPQILTAEQLEGLKQIRR